MAQRSEKLTFTGSQGDALDARLELPPDGQVRAWAIFAHCFTCSKQIPAATQVSRALAEEGIAVLRFDFTGLGHSDGEFANTTFTSNVEDLVLAADYLRTYHGAPSLLVGHSFGGAAVIAAAVRIPEVRAVVTINAPADPADVRRHLVSAEAEIEEYGEAEVELAGRPFRIRRQFLEDIAEQPQQDRLARLKAALLILHAPTDNLVGVDNARRIFEAARHPKSFVALDGANHFLTGADDARFAAQVVASWAGRYVFDEAPGGQQDPPAEGVVEVTETGEGSFQQRIRVGGHTLTGDEPRPVGDDTGPAPYDLLLAALGTCTSMTVRMYAERKGWPLEGVRVQLRHSRVHAADLEQAETQSGKVDHIERHIEFAGPLDVDQRRRLAEIADRCPVHRTLTSEIIIDTGPMNPDTAW